MSNYGQYLKAIVAVIGAVAIGLQTAYPSSHWATTITATITSALVFLTPNAPKITAPEQPAPPKAPGS